MERILELFLVVEIVLIYFLLVGGLNKVEVVWTGRWAGDRKERITEVTM